MLDFFFFFFAGGRCPYSRPHIQSSDWAFYPTHRINGRWQRCTPYWVTEPGDVVGRNYVERKHRSQYLYVFAGLKLSPSLYGPTHQLAHRVSFRWFAGERPRFLPVKKWISSLKRSINNDNQTSRLDQSLRRQVVNLRSRGVQIPWMFLTRQFL